MQVVKDLLNIDDPEDSFTQSLRKVVSLLNLVLAPFAMAYGCYWVWLGLVNDAGAGTGTIIMGILMFGLGIVQIVNLALTIKWGHVSDLQLNILQWITIFPVCGTVFGTPEFGVRMLLFWYAILCVSQQSAHSVIQCVIALVASVISCYNDSYKGTTNSLIYLPGARLSGPPLEVMGGVTGCNVVGFMAVLAVYVQGRAYGEKYRQAKLGEEARAAVALAQHVGDLLQRYDTDRVSAYLDSDAAASVDPKLLATFKSIKDNLEVYRPHLPNYLFQETDAAEEEKYVKLAAVRRSLGTSDRGTSERDLPRNSKSTGHAEDDTTMVEVMSAGDSDEDNNPSAKDDPLRHSVGGKPQGSNNMMTNSEPSSFAGEPTSGSIMVTAAPMFASPFFGAVVGGQPDGAPGGLGLPGEEVTSAGSLGVRRDIEGIPGLNANRVTLAYLDCQLLTSGHDSVFGVTENALQHFIDSVYSFAAETKASVHTMVGDVVIVTWNATSVVAAHEGRAAKFLARVSQASKKCGYLVSGAAASGRSYLYSHMSKTKQKALMVHPSGWQGALDAALALARRYNTIIVDAAVQRGSQHDCDLRAVDYALHTSDSAEGGVTSDYKLALDLLPSEWQGRMRSPQTGQSQSNANQYNSNNVSGQGIVGGSTNELAEWTSTPLYEVLMEVKQEDGEWMYQLENKENKNTGNSAVSNALEDIDRGNFAAALSAFRELRDSKSKEDQKIMKGSMVRRMMKYCEKHGSLNGGRSK